MPDKEGFVRGLVEMANARAQGGHPANSGELREVIQSHDVVFGIWLDEAEQFGVGTRIIKGDALLHSSVDTHRVLNKGMTAIYCRNAEEAEAMRRVFGEFKLQH